MKERLLTVLAAVALLISIQHATLPSIAHGIAGSVIAPYGDCQDGDVCH